MPILCYEISGDAAPNERSTTGAVDGHQEARAQMYCELAANRLAMFLGIPVLVGVPARRSIDSTVLRFAALRIVEAGLDIYRLSCRRKRCFYNALIQFVAGYGADGLLSIRAASASQVAARTGIPLIFVSASSELGSSMLSMIAMLT